MFENPRRGRQARNFTANVPKILDLQSSSEQIFSEKWRWVPLFILRISLFACICQHNFTRAQSIVQAFLVLILSDLVCLRAQMQPISPCAGAISFGWEPGDEVLFVLFQYSNKQNGRPVQSAGLLEYTQICVARGIVSWWIKDDAAGELQLCYHERDNEYRIYARKTAGGGEWVCKVIDVFTLHSPKVHWQNQNVINEEVEISFRPILKTYSTMWEYW